MKKNIITAIMLLPTFLMAQTTISTGLKAYYKFDGNYADSSGNNNHGFSLGSFTADRRGNSNKAASFNGTSSYISIPASTSLNSIKTDFSVSTWVYVTNWFNWGGFKYAPIICKTQISTAAQYRFTLLDNAFDVISNTKKFYHTIPMTINTGTWYHVAVSNSGDSCKLYVNGEFVQLTLNEAVFPSDTNQLLEIGRDVAGSLDYLNGSLDELRIYNRALTNQDVVNLYNFTGTSVLKLNQNKPSFTVYPNPSNGKFHFENSNIAVQSIEIINSLGEIVFVSDKFTENIEINSSKKGIYIIRITDKNNAIYTEKVIVE